MFKRILLLSALITTSSIMSMNENFISPCVPHAFVFATFIEEVRGKDRKILLEFFDSLLALMESKPDSFKELLNPFNALHEAIKTPFKFSHEEKTRLAEAVIRVILNFILEDHISRHKDECTLDVFIADILVNRKDSRLGSLLILVLTGLRNGFTTLYYASTNEMEDHVDCHLLLQAFEITKRPWTHSTKNVSSALSLIAKKYLTTVSMLMENPGENVIFEPNRYPKTSAAYDKI